MHPGGRWKEARVVLGVAVERPREAIGSACRQRRRRLRDEAGVWVVDAPRPTVLIQVDAQPGADQRDEDARRRESPAGGAGEQPLQEPAHRARGVYAASLRESEEAREGTSSATRAAA